MNPPFDTAQLFAIAAALGWASGLRLYAVVFLTGLAGWLGWVTLPSGLHALQSPLVLGASGFMLVVEFFADKIPGFDLLWSAAHTFIRIPLAALIAFGATSQLPPAMQALAAVLGGSLAMLAHTSKTAARILVTPSPEPVSNIVLSGAEDVGAVGLTWIATQHPVAAGGVAVVLAVLAIVAIWMTASALGRLWRRTWDRKSSLFRPSSTVSGDEDPG